MSSQKQRITHLHSMAMQSYAVNLDVQSKLVDAGP